MVARVALLVPSHALPPLSYRVPERMRDLVGVGAAVVAPLSGYSRLGIVVAFEDPPNGDADLKELRSVQPSLSLPDDLIRACARIAASSATPLAAVLAAALPPGARADSCRVVRPAEDWPWEQGAVVGRRELRRALGATALVEAEATGRVVFAPEPPAPREVEWAVLADGVSVARGPKGRLLLEALGGHGGAWPSLALLRETGAGRDSLARLVRRGAVRLEGRPEPLPVAYSRGSGAGLAAHSTQASLAFEGPGSASVWRVPTEELPVAAAAVVRAAVGRGGAALVLVPEVADVEATVGRFSELLPAGLSVAAYHGGLTPRARAAVYGALPRGEVDVVVGTRAAALLPVPGPAAIVVLDEPNGAHRAETGHEGVPLHVREISLARVRSEGATAVFISPTPSLRLWDPASGTRRLPAREPTKWPSARVVDLRGTGAVLSSALLGACRAHLDAGGRVGVLVNRLGRASLITCAACGHVPSCPRCALPLVPLGSPGSKRGDDALLCRRCGRREEALARCPECGSERIFEAGVAVEGVRDALAEALDVEVGLLTSAHRHAEGAAVIVGTARHVAGGRWDLVVVPDADALLFGGGVDPVEAGFRALYRAAEAGRETILAQSRKPEHPALLAALRGDYEGFAEDHLPKRRALGFPPHGHGAEVAFRLSEGAARRAVESWLREADPRSSGVELAGPVPAAGEDAARKVLMRGRGLAEVAGAAARLGRYLAKGGVRVRITVDPEEA